jgi:hypothetical protein
VCALTRSLRQRTVGADDTPPGKIGVVALEEGRTGKAWCTGRDVAIGTDETGRDLADTGEDFE